MGTRRGCRTHSSPCAVAVRTACRGAGMPPAELAVGAALARARRLALVVGPDGRRPVLDLEPRHLRRRRSVIRAARRCRRRHSLPHTPPRVTARRALPHHAPPFLTAPLTVALGPQWAHGSPRAQGGAAGAGGYLRLRRCGVRGSRGDWALFSTLRRVRSHALGAGPPRARGALGERDLARARSRPCPSRGPARQSKQRSLWTARHVAGPRLRDLAAAPVAPVPGAPLRRSQFPAQTDGPTALSDLFRKKAPTAEKKRKAPTKSPGPY